MDKDKLLIAIKTSDLFETAWKYYNLNSCEEAVAVLDEEARMLRDIILSELKEEK